MGVKERDETLAAAALSIFSTLSEEVKWPSARPARPPFEWGGEGGEEGRTYSLRLDAALTCAQARPWAAAFEPMVGKSSSPAGPDRAAALTEPSAPASPPST